MTAGWVVQGGLVLEGRYRLDTRVGRGGMGEVWRATDLRLRRAVAVKVLPPGLATESEDLARFEREARLSAGLQHPGITVVFDIGEHEGRTFFVMEFLDGRPLDRVLAEQPGGLAVDRALSIAAQVADALAAAHAHGIVHRDVKPANLMLLAGDRVKICDFGIARLAAATAQLTSTGVVLGTLAFMAPEQCQGERVDARADLYALGCVLHNMLTGRPPFCADNPAALMLRHISAAPPRPSTLRPQVSAQVDQLVLDLLAKDPDHRPQGASVAAHRLRAATQPPTTAPAAAAAPDATTRIPSPPRSSAAASRARSTALNRMLLPELRLAAAELGIRGATRMPKSQLIEEITAARAGRGGSAAAEGPGQARGLENEAPLSRRERYRRRNGPHSYRNTVEEPEALRAQLTDPLVEPYDRVRAAASLAARGGDCEDEGASYLMTAMHDTAHAIHLRVSAAERLAGLGGRHRANALAALKAIMQAQSEDKERAWVAAALARLDPAGARQALQACFDWVTSTHGTEFEKADAARCLSELAADRAAQAAELLYKRALDPGRAPFQRCTDARTLPTLVPEHTARAAAVLTGILRDDQLDANERRRAANYLAELGTQYHERAADELERVIASPDTSPKVLAFAAGTLNNCGRRGAAATAARRALAHPGITAFDRDHALLILSMLGREHRDEVIAHGRAIMNSDSAGLFHRVRAATLLARHAGEDGRTEAVDFLRAVAHDRTSTVDDRVRAAKELAKINPASRDEVAAILAGLD